MYLFGASGHCKVVIDIVLSSTDKVIKSIFDDNSDVKSISEIPVYTYQNKPLEDEELVVCIGDNKIRKKIAEKLKAKYIIIQHKDATVSPNSSIGIGSVIMPQVVVNAAAIIGKHCIINSGSIVEHDCILANFVHVSPKAALAGNVNIGEGTHIGIGAQVIQGVSIGKWVTVGAGSVVLEDIPDYAVVVGNPAKIIKIKKHEK
jgi:acetyltransferase EpsM